MSNAEKMVPVPREWLELLVEAGPGEAISRSEIKEIQGFLGQPTIPDVEYEIAGYEGSSGLYYSRLSAVANGEQSVEPVYRVKK